MNIAVAILIAVVLVLFWWNVWIHTKLNRIEREFENDFKYHRERYDRDHERIYSKFNEWAIRVKSLEKHFNLIYFEPHTSIANHVEDKSNKK